MFEPLQDARGSHALEELADSSESSVKSCAATNVRDRGACRVGSSNGREVDDRKRIRPPPIDGSFACDGRKWGSKLRRCGPARFSSYGSSGSHSKCRFVGAAYSRKYTDGSSASFRCCGPTKFRGLAS